MTLDEIRARLRDDYEPEKWLELLRFVLPGTDVFASPQAIVTNTPDITEASVVFYK